MFKLGVNIIVLFLLLQHCYSQTKDSLMFKYINQTISRYGYNFLKGNEKLMFKDLPNELSNSELSMVSFKLAKKNKITSIVFTYLSLASSFAAVLLINSNRDLSYGFMGSQFVFILLGSRHRQLFNQHLDRALWLYNKDLLFPEKLH